MCMKANFDPKSSNSGVDLYDERVEVDKHRVVFPLLQGAEWIGEEQGEAGRPARRLMQQSGREMVAAWPQVVAAMQGGERIPERQRKWHYQGLVIY